jgi:hypothetical protein
MKIVSLASILLPTASAYKSAWDALIKTENSKNAAKASATPTPERLDSATIHNVASSFYRASSSSLSPMGTEGRKAYLIPMGTNDGKASPQEAVAVHKALEMKSDPLVRLGAAMASDISGNVVKAQLQAVAAKPMQGPQQGVDGTFVFDTKTETWVPTKKTWEDMVTCPDQGKDDSCLARKSQCNMRHNTYKETGKGPKFLFDAGEECCCGERKVTPEEKCNPKECAEWSCKDWCKCFKAEPQIVEIFEGPNPSQWDLAVRDLCPADNDDCDCTPFLHGNAKEERLTRGAPKVLTIADKRLASLQATGCPRKEPLPKWWVNNFDSQRQDPELVNMNGYCQYALPGKTYDAKKLDICCGEGKTCEVKSCRRLTEFVADPNEHVASMAEKRLATLQATGCPRTKKLPEWWVEHFHYQDGLKEMQNMMGYCTYASTDKSTRDTSKQDICCGEGKTCEVKSCTKQTKWSTRKDVEDLLMLLGAKSQIQIVTDLSGNQATRAASCEPPKVKCHSKHGYHCVSEHQCDRMNQKPVEWIMPTV